MIYFLTDADHQFTIHWHLASFGAGLKRRVRALSYKELFGSRRLQPGLYIFADLERLHPDDAERAAKIWQAMNGREGFRLLNHPTRSMRRYELLRTMHLQGTNRFNVYRLTELRSPSQFPVYLRGENDHKANRTPLLKNPAELAAAYVEVDQSGRSREETLITEYLDVSDADGVFHKYSAFCVAGTIVPRHLCFERQWMVKQSVLVDPPYVKQEREYLASNPHQAELQEIFRTARIDYGRIDYAILDGAIQVWEINTNPTICSKNVAGGPVRRELQSEFAAKLQQALENQDTACPSGGRRSIRIDPRATATPRPRKSFANRIRRFLQLSDRY